jgi:predicted MFS family arabinose efflux permease
LTIVLVAPFGGRLADRTGPVRAATIAMCLIVPVTVLYGSLPWPVAIAAIAVLESFPQAVASPAVQTAMLRAGGDDDVAAGQGLINSLNMLGGTIVGLLAPLGYAALGPEVLFALAGAAMAAVFGAGLLLLRRGGGQHAQADNSVPGVVP